MGNAHFKFALKILVTVSIWLGFFTFFILFDENFDSFRKIPVEEELQQKAEKLKNVISDENVDKKEFRFLADIRKEKKSEVFQSKGREKVLAIIEESLERGVKFSPLEKKRYYKSIDKYIEDLRKDVYFQKIVGVVGFICVTLLMSPLFSIYRKELKNSILKSEEYF